MTASDWLAQILPYLDVDRGPDRRGEYAAWCPYHPDGQGKPPHEPNLHVSERGFICFACGAKGGLKKLAQKLGIDIDGGNGSAQPRRIRATYAYRDESGNLLFEVVRTDPRGFYQRRPDGKGGWLTNLDGTRRVLYRLPELLTNTEAPLWIVEGEKDADRLAKEGLVATTNPGGAGKWWPEYREFLRGRDVVILPDNDEPGEHHTQDVAQSLAAVASSIKILHLPGLPAKGDVSVWLDAGHTIAELQRLADSTAECDTGPTPGSTDIPADLPQIQVNGRQLREIIVDTWQAVHQANTPTPKMFTRAGSLVHLVEQGGRLSITHHTVTSLYGHLARIADWVKATTNSTAQAWPPKDVARDLLACPDLGLPDLDTLVSSPRFGSDGMLLREDGYHTADKLWLDGDKGLFVPDVLSAPTSEDIAQARALILNELLVDFPFVSEADRAHAVAALLLPFVRRLVDGCTPLHLVEAPTAGSGKGLFCNLIFVCTEGRAGEAQSLANTDEETRKRITAELLRGRSIILLDNAPDRGKIDSAALSSVLTAEYWTDRLMGESRMVTVPNRALWLLTANNPRLSMEIARRCVRIRIDPRMDRPWRRTEFKHPDILAWAKENRARILHALFVFVQTWLSVDRPLHPIRLGSFENWSQIIGGILKTSGIEGFLGNLDSFYEASDVEGQMWREFVKAWWEAHGDQPQGISDLRAFSEQNDLMVAVRGDGSDKSQATRLGLAIQKTRDRVFDRYKIVLDLDRGKKGKTYRVMLTDDSRSEKQGDLEPVGGPLHPTSP